MYTRILVPLDGSPLAERILPFARLFAESAKVPVQLLSVIEPRAMSPSLAVGEYLAKMAERYFPNVTAASRIVELVDPATTIVDTAAADRGTLIAMATHGLSGIQRLFFGSVAYKVVHMALNPMLLIRPEEQTRGAKAFELTSVFVPLDGSGLAEKILPFVTRLATIMNLEVVLIRAYTLPAEAFLMGDGVLLGGLQRVRDESRQRIDTYLNGKVEQLQAEGLWRVSAIAVEGDGAAQIIDVARKTPNNLIAMSTHGRSGLERWTLGSVAEKVIQHSSDPVLLLRPS